MARSKNFDADMLFEDIRPVRTVEEVKVEKKEEEKEEQKPIIKAVAPSPVKTEPKPEPEKRPEAPVKEVKADAIAAPADEEADLEEAYYRARGRKGAGWETLHIRVTSDIKHYINHESCRRGIPKTLFINQIIEQYMNSPKGRIKLD